MALIVAQDIIIDESTGLTDDDVNPSVPPHSTTNNATVQYLLTTLDDPGGLTPPEVAFQANFVQVTPSAGETITSLILAQNSSGTPFSTTVGVNSGIRTLDGNYVWLFKDADPTHANVVIGVIGTSDQAAEPAETGPLAFSFALISTSNTTADLYTVQYVPLLHLDATNPDDRIDLNDKVFASVTGTTVVNFSQLGDAPPGHNNWYILDADVAGTQKILVTAHDNGVQTEVNVSTQGLGVASQDVRFGRELQIDLINGGTQSAGKNFTDAPAPNYDTHIETISSAGFSISQSTPTNTKADIEIHAYNNDDNAEGTALPLDDNDAEINITGVTFKLNGVVMTAQQLGITVDLDGAGAGLILRNVGEGVTVDFTTAGGVGGTFDRFTIKNIDTQKDYFDVKEVHFAGGTTNFANQEVGSFINFDDDGPSFVDQDPAADGLQAIDTDSVIAGIQTEEHLGNAANQTASGLVDWNVGNDPINNYATGSDFKDLDPGAGVTRISLTGTVGDQPNSDNDVITQAVVTRVSPEDANDALFNFTFHFDANPAVAGVQDGTAGGTLAFDKDAGTYTVTLTDPVDGFQTTIVKTSGAIERNPDGNSGHPQIVIEQLDDDFFVQFSANSLNNQNPTFSFSGNGEGNTNDHEYNNGDQITNNFEDWVSATENTNGVAGDTIQKGEVLSLRFFAEDRLADGDDQFPNQQGLQQIETLNPTTTKQGIAIEFDGVGTSEDLIVVLDLKDANGMETTRSITVNNGDLFTTNTQLAGTVYSTFDLDNNDALLVIEQNDYNLPGETYEIQGVQIMQSANGLTGTGINLNGAIGAAGGSNTADGADQDNLPGDAFSFQSWTDASFGNEQDVLKITDIGFVETQQNGQDADLAFNFAINDGDGDSTGTQTLNVNISNDFI